MSTTPLPVRESQAAGPLKVALLSLPERTEAVLEFFFSNNGGAHFIACGEAEADAAVIDLDTAESRAHWARFHASTGRPAIALSVTPQTEPHTVWVRKPVTPAAMVEAAGQVLHLPPEAAPVETPPEPAAPSNVVAWPLTPAAMPAVTPAAIPAALPDASPDAEQAVPQTVVEAPLPTMPPQASAAVSAPAPTSAAEADDPFALPPRAPQPRPWWRRWWQAVFGAPAAPVARFDRSSAPIPPREVTHATPGASDTQDLAPAAAEAIAAGTPSAAESLAPATEPTVTERVAASLDPEPDLAQALPMSAPDDASPDTEETPDGVTDAAAEVEPEAPADTTDETTGETTDDTPDAGLRAVPDDEAADEARWCGGLREDRPVGDFLSDRSLVYRPAQHLIGAVGEAALVGRKWQVPTRFDLDGLGVVVDVRRNLLHVEPSFAAFEALLTTELGRRVKTRTLSHAETQDWEARRASHGEARALDHSLWCAALSTAAGRWPDDLDPQATLYLKHWPNLTRLPRTPHAMRIAALWATRGASLADTARSLRIAQRHVIAFGNAARALDLITADGSHIARAQRKGSRHRSALTRLLGWLNR